jgi:hypothetical protein
VGPPADQRESPAQVASTHRASFWA